MKNLTLKKSIASFFLVAVLATQSFFGIQYVVRPQPAQAFLGIGDITFSFNTEVGNFYDIAKDIGTAAAKRIANSYIDKYLGKFVDQLLDKYKIRNYLYYAQLLDVYYLNQYIADKIEDPDLRGIYTTLSSNVRINIYTTNEAEKRKLQETLAQTKKKMIENYEARGGISTEAFLNPDPNLSQAEKFQLAQTYHANSPEASEKELLAKFATLQEQSGKAADQEIDGGDGNKSGRTTQETVINGVRKIQTAISNPASFVQDQARGAINKLFDNSSDPNNIWSTVGSMLGSYIFRNLEKAFTDDEVPQEYPTNDELPTEVTLAETLDLDADGFPDGEDADGDGALDSPEDLCFHGGVPGVGTGCRQSSNVSSSAFFTPLCQGLDKTIAALIGYVDFMERNADLLKPNGEDFKVEADANIWGRRAQLANSEVDNFMRTLGEYRNPNLDRMEIAVGRFSEFMNKNIQSLFKDRDMDLARRGDGGGGLQEFITSTTLIIEYLQEAKSELGKCEDPDFESVGAIEPPDIDYPGTCDVPPGARGNDAGAPTTAPNINEVVFREAGQVAGWEETGTLSSVSADETSITLSYNKAGTWPPVNIADPGDPEALAVANPWIMVWRGGAWQATTYSWLRPNQYAKDVDEVWCGGLGGSPTLGDFMPVVGETYGFMVSMIARNATFSAQQAALNGGKQERTNILMYRWTSGGNNPPGSGHICSDTGGTTINYANSLQAGLNHIINTNPDDIANKFNNATNSSTFLTLVASYLESIGFRSTVNVLNGNGNPNKGHLIGIWREGDSTIERYDAIIGMEQGTTPIRDAATAGTFTGDIPLVCRY